MQVSLIQPERCYNVLCWVSKVLAHAHLENVDMDVGQGEHGPAHHHAHEGAEG